MLYYSIPYTLSLERVELVEALLGLLLAGALVVLIFLGGLGLLLLAIGLGCRGWRARSGRVALRFIHLVGSRLEPLSTGGNAVFAALGMGRP